MKRTLLALVLAGCAHAPEYVSLAPPQQQSKPKDYYAEINTWTRRADSLHDFDATLIAYATFHSPEFQDAFIEKYISAYRVNENARQGVRDSLRESIAEGWTFHLETQSHTYELNDLKPPKSVWRTTLIDDKGREVSPLSVGRDNSRPEVLQTFYPYNGIFSQAWRVTFPKALPDGSALVTPDTKSLMLRIAGPPGTIELVWKLQP